MGNFVECAVNVMKKYGDNIALTDSTHSMTYKELYLASGKIYAWIKEKGLGKEDFVQIVMPRSIEVFVACMGIWRAGAAFVICEADYPQSRIDFIRKDLDAKFVIDKELYQKIMANEFSKDDYEEPDSHDSAFAVYTSGSTGNPKGVLHEYGNLDLIAQYAPIMNSFGLMASLNFVAALTGYMFVIKQGGRLFLIPYSLLKKPLSLKEYFIRNNITEVFCVSSIYSVISQISSLKYIYISSEIARGIWSTNRELNVINVYSMSESGFIIAMKNLTEPNEIAPIGKINPNIVVTLRDKEGIPVNVDEGGELCFYNPYVRGYINLPEETAGKFVNGETRTGDFAKRLPNGDYAILGRLDDMVNINGNRVEPAEVELIVQKVTNLKNVMAKGFNEQHSSFIALYYTDSVELDEDTVRKNMAKFVPYYMIPSRFIHLEEFPRTKTGKLSRRLLPKPNFKTSATVYVPPENDIEKILCNAVVSVLKIPCVSISDDFYALGGSSLTAMKLIVECNLAGLSLNMIYEGRTPQKIAALYQEFLAKKKDVVEIDLKKTYPLTQTQLVVYKECMLNEGKPIYNNPRLYRLPLYVDTMRLQVAVVTALKAHLGLFCRIVSDGKTLAMQFEPTFFEGNLCKINCLSETAFDVRKENLVKPFNIHKDRLFRMEIFKTEQAVYLFGDFHHIIFDGVSAQILFADINRAFKGERISAEEYTPYHVAAEEVLNRRGRAFIKAKSWYTNCLKNVKGLSIPEGDMAGNKVTYAKINFPIKLARAELGDFCSANNLSENVVTLSAFNRLLAVYTNEMNPTFTTAYNGRKDSRFSGVVAMLAKILPVHLNITENINIFDYFTEMRYYILEAMANDIYSFAEISDTFGISSDIEFIWQDEMAGMPTIDDIVIEKVHLPFQSMGQILFVQLFTYNNQLLLKIRYQSNRYSEIFIRQFAANYEEILRQMMNEKKLCSVNILNK